MALFRLFPLLCLALLLQIRQVRADSCPQKYTLTVPEAAQEKRPNKDKLIIAHRGASFHLPEHTIAAYRLALEMGADFIEPDLVATRDGRLIALHTADLNVTTNVEEVFGATRQPWLSPFVNRSGYWSFNFTLDEIKQLKVHQRLPRARTKAYDGLFGVPTFLEIRSLVNEWNTERVPEIQRHVDDNDNNNATTTTVEPHEHYQQTAGVYAELKSSPWFQADANISLVELLLKELEENRDIFQSTLECPSIFKFDEYRVPPLVVQSFEGSVLQDLSEKWKDHPVLQASPLPPMILLLNTHSCWEESVWFEIGETWRAYVQGLGVDKACFPLQGDDVEKGKGAKEQAEEFNLVVHPWTERPEHEFLMDGFSTGLEETRYLLCNIGAQGVFSESVHTALLAARLGCQDDNKEQAAAEAEKEEKDEAAEASSSEDAAVASTKGSGEESNNNNGKDEKAKKSLCWEDTSEANLYLGVASFVMGVFITAMISTWVNRGFSCTPRPPRQQQIPTGEEISENGGFEETPDDELL